MLSSKGFIHSFIPSPNKSGWHNTGVGAVVSVHGPIGLSSTGWRTGRSGARNYKCKYCYQGDIQGAVEQVGEPATGGQKKLPEDMALELWPKE